MSLASEVLTWQESNRLYSRLTTNVSTPRLIRRLVALRILQWVETIHAYFGDRAEGVSGYEVLWKKHVQWDDLQAVLIRL